MITVVIPLYNKTSTIIRALDSVLGQTVKPGEIIVVDDGSTDGSAKKVEALKNPFINVIHQSNFGVSAARNKGSVLAKGEWIAFLDADDEWEPGFLEEVSGLISRYPNCIGAATSYYLGNENGERAKINPVHISFPGESGILNNYFEVASFSSSPICSSSVCVRKDKLLAIGGFPEGIRSGEDLLTWARLATTGDFAYSLKPSATFWQEKAHTYEGAPSRIPDKEDPVGKELVMLYRRYTGPQKKWLKKYIGLWHKMRASVYLRLGMDRMAFHEILLASRHKQVNIKTLAYLVLIVIPGRYRNAIFKKFSG